MLAAERADAGAKETADTSTFLQLYGIHSSLISNHELKRQQSNQIYMALTSALVTAGAVIGAEDATKYAVVTDLCALMVAVICSVWFLSIQYHRRLSRAKFHVILALENFLPAKPFHDEWERFNDPLLRPRSLELTKIEALVPITLGAAALIFLISRNSSILHSAG